MFNNGRMTKLTPDVLEKLWAVQIEILEEIVRLCQKYNLSYFLNYGTLIGAIRHRGFIPWDDDLDIGMPRDDYETFLRVAKEELDEKFFLQNSDTETQYWLPFSKIRKNDTIFEESSLARMDDTIHKGIFVDIFPLDYVKKHGGFFVHVQFILSKAINETMYYKAGVYSGKESLKYRTLDMVLSKLPFKTLCRLQKKVASLQGKGEKEFLADFCSSRKYLESIYPADYFIPVQETEFAGKKFCVPNKYDLYLKTLYGDYMQLPKEEDRVNHCTMRIVFDTTKEE